MYSQEELNRVVALYEEVESRKTHEYAAPTYKDSPALTEMAGVILSHQENTVEVLEEKIPALAYLADCYDRMCRWGVSAGYYKALVEALVTLRGLRAYDKEDKERLEDAFYSAIKARNQYAPDDCEDLLTLVGDCLPAGKRDKLLSAAKDSRRGLPKNDPVELTPEYLAVIDRVEEKIDQVAGHQRGMGFCHKYWSLKARYLAEYGIAWRSPAQLNPGVMFD